MYSSSTDRGPIDFFTAGARGERFTNPFYGVPLQYLPLNIDAQLWWAEHFQFRFGFFRAALARIANYFVTSMVIEVADEEARKQYEEILNNLLWKDELSQIGLNLLVYGNEFLSVNQGFNRFLVCPKCGKSSNIEKINNFKFNKGHYHYTCKKCNFNGEHECTDIPSKDVDKMKIVHWSPRQIRLRYEDTTGQAEYFWDIPHNYIQKVTTKNNTFYSKNTPRPVYDCIYDKGGKKMLAFNKNNFLHLKTAVPSSLATDGKAIPPCIFLFDDFWMNMVMKRANEALCYEDIVPFRVIAMGKESNSMANPLFHQDGSLWNAAVDAMIEQHRDDPGAYHKFPFPIDYQQLGGQAKNLVPVDMLKQSKADILGSLNLPIELFEMNLQTQAVGPCLRLFENAWSIVPSSYNRVLQHWADVISKIKGLPKAKISLIPTTMADDVEKKSIIGQLVSANAIARSELLKIVNLDYEDQVKKKMREDEIVQELQQEEQEKKQLEQSATQSILPSQQGQGGAQGAGAQVSGPSTPQDILEQAQELAQEIFPLGPSDRRAKLQEIKNSQGETLWASVKTQLQQMGTQAKGQGMQQAQQSAAQGQGGG